MQPDVIVPVVGAISFFGSLGFIMYIYLKSRNKERLALIEAGQDASIFKSDRDLRSSLKWGILLVAIGVAMFLGHFVETYTAMEDGAGYAPLIFIFGGAALIYYYRLSKSEYPEI